MLGVSGELADSEDAGAETVGSRALAKHLCDEFRLRVTHFPGCRNRWNRFGDGDIRIGRVERDGDRRDEIESRRFRGGETKVDKAVSTLEMRREGREGEIKVDAPTGVDYTSYFAVEIIVGEF